MTDDYRPHPKNVPGPFYVVNECCMSCEVPFVEAPGLFAYDHDNHCYVKRQPATKDELDRTIRAAWAAEVDCIRYRGREPEILRRFAESGLAYLCDVPPPPEIRAAVRDVVTFDSNSPDHTHLSAVDLADLYREDVLRRERQREERDARFRYRITPVTGDRVTASLAYSWGADELHKVEFRNFDAPGSRWLIRHFSAGRIGGQSVSNQLDDWLKGAGGFRHIRWYSAAEWFDGGPGRDTPL